ncbi:hypothetical protein LzC2_17830 [Planctomycetes bacterium LzC2]|uniref:Uncharacterized protein n=1 Tax=Alienimonas chondri TaxID=2681879 RepID=A0ABX1VCQ2_9PLAN|nr:hypothetical protein [Alienimonas chondri]
MTCGRLNTWTDRFAASARSNTETLALEALSTNPPNPSSAFARPKPKLFSPWTPVLAGFAATLFPSGTEVLLKLKPGVVL